MRTNLTYTKLRAARSFKSLCGLAAITLCVTRDAQGQSAMWNLGSLGANASSAVGISADGGVIVGWSGANEFTGAAFRWSDATGMSAFFSGDAVAAGVSRDGTTIVGSVQGSVGFRWRQTGTTYLWGPATFVSFNGEKLHGIYANSGLVYSYRFVSGASTDVTHVFCQCGVYETMALSGDGDTVVGQTSQRASRYSFATNTFTDLGALPGGSFSSAKGTTFDGSFVVGDAIVGSGPPPYQRRAFLWSALGGMQNLGTLGGPESVALGVSDDGTVVVGSSLNASGSWRAFRWTATSGMVDLGTLGGAESRARAITPDGQLIVGEAQLPGGAWRAFVYGVDCDANGIPDIYDLRADPARDCNTNGVLDTCDLASGTSLDLDQNGCPDECGCTTCVAPSVYCAAKVNSQFCVPSIAISGPPKLSGSSPSVVVATNILNGRNGLLFYGYQPSAAPFQGGTLCVQGSIRRTAVQNSGAVGASSNCAGSFQFDMNAFITSGADPLLQVVGQTFACQFWSRDPGDPFGSSLTNAVLGQVCQ